MNNDQLKQDLDEAIDRINDMLAGDDGQAFKEARKFVERVAALSADQPQEQPDNPVATITVEGKNWYMDFLSLPEGTHKLYLRGLTYTVAPVQLAAQRDAVRNAALEEAAQHIEEMNQSAGDASAYDDRAMHEWEQGSMFALQSAAKRIRALQSQPAPEGKQ